MRGTKTKALISFAVTAKLICVFVFAYAVGFPTSWLNYYFTLLSSEMSQQVIK